MRLQEEPHHPVKGKKNTNKAKIGQNQFEAVRLLEEQISLKMK